MPRLGSSLYTQALPQAAARDWKEAGSTAESGGPVGQPGSV